MDELTCCQVVSGIDYRTETDKGDKSGLLVKKLAVRWSGGLTRRRIDTNLFFESFVETILFDF